MPTPKLSTAAARRRWLALPARDRRELIAYLCDDADSFDHRAAVLADADASRAALASRAAVAVLRSISPRKRRA